MLQKTLGYCRHFVAFAVLTITVFPHVTFGAACCVPIRPGADAVLCDHLRLSQALQRVHFAHVQSDGFSSHRRGGTQLQR